MTMGNMFSIKKIKQKLFVSLPLKIHRLLNRNRDFTIISRDCIGGMLYHQYGLRFLSPTINLFLEVEDFNIFCLYLKDYLEADLVRVENAEISYPIGQLIPKSTKIKSIVLNFMHYESFEEAYKKWNERKKRINWKNIYVINNCTSEKYEHILTPEIIKDFNSIPYKKMIFVRRKLGFDGEYVMHTNKQGFPSHVLDRKNNSYKYGFNQFNFNRFFNKKHQANLVKNKNEK